VWADSEFGTESLQIQSQFQNQIWRDSVLNCVTEYLPGVDLDKSGAELAFQIGADFGENLVNQNLSHWNKTNVFAHYSFCKSFFQCTGV